jgi:predicted lipoprotein with Yx(FWY)xxD motif
MIDFQDLSREATQRHRRESVGQIEPGEPNRRGRAYVGSTSHPDEGVVYVRRVLVAVVCLATLSTAACSRSDPASEAAPASHPPAGDIRGTLILRAQNSPQLGEIVVDGNGYPLYRYDRDTARPPQSNCLDDCWSSWPPVVDTSDIRLEGLDQALIGSVTRPDSTRQVTIGGWPVYRHAGDTTPGEAAGHGADNLWYAIAPTGRKAAGTTN